MVGVRLKETAFEGVYLDRGDHYTRNMNPGVSVYGERLRKVGGIEYRFWDPNRSKAATMLGKGCGNFPFNRASSVLYLGAATGTTPSHISDICVEGRVHCVEFSQRSFRKLLQLAGERKNLVPMLNDANRPEAYARYVAGVDVVYQDVAQRNQVEIFTRNMEHFHAPRGVLMLKARSVDIGANVGETFREAGTELRTAGLKVLESIDLAPQEKDHMAFVVRSRE